MTLPASGQISLSQVNTELGYSSTASITMNDSAVRTLFGVSSGAISMSNGWGKANAWSGTITSNQQQLNLRTWATGAGWNGTTKATITVNAGVYIWSDSTGTAGLTIDGSWPGGCFLVNNGYIMGKGGAGGGNNGGPAISLGVSCTITNNSYIAGGGGGGAHSIRDGNPYYFGAGGGAGGGAGQWSWSGGLPGGPGGAVGQAGGNGGKQFVCDTANHGHYSAAGAGGGRILPGTGGPGGHSGGPCGNRSSTASGGGGAGGGGAGNFWLPATGGSGGSAGAVGGNSSGNCGMGGGGGWGARGGYATSGFSGHSQTPGAGGKAVALNGYTVTWVTSGTLYGAVS